MARIFYWTETGRVYGVNPDERLRNGTVLPEGIAWLDVPEAPHRIPWPARDGRPGCEQWSRVVDGALVLRDDLPPVRPDPVETAVAAIGAADSLEGVKAALIAHVRALRGRA